MGFKSIKTYRYRNLNDSEVAVDAPEIFLIGKNGQGKTNFLETIYLLCYGTSFRTKKDNILCKDGRGSMSVSGSFRLEDSSLNGDNNDILFKYDKKKKFIFLNNKIIKDRKELIYNIPCLIFSHDDIGFITGPPERRRWFINQTLSLYDPLFVDHLRSYNKVLKNRNTVLKAEGDNGLLDIYDQQLAVMGTRIQRKRKETLDSFNETFTNVFLRVSDLGKHIYLRYKPSWSETLQNNEIIDKLKDQRGYDRSIKFTSTGPHRDRIIFELENKDFAQIASTGQLRLISLALRIAQAIFFTNKTGRKPLFLIDDVLLELDREKRKRFLDLLPPYRQAFFTFLPDENYRNYLGEKTICYSVENGTVKRK